MIYEPIALRYRPRILKDVIGQEAITGSIRKMLVSGNITRSILLSGPFGSGKTTLARIIAMAVNCESSKKGDPCLKCSSCTRLLSGIPNAHAGQLELNAASERGIDMVRSIQDRVKFQTREKFRVVILDECHQLTSQAQQAFLKTLEEPPKQTIFILVTTEPEGLLPTIRSRCLQYNLKYIPILDTAKLVYRIMKKEGVDVTDTHKKIAEKISASANGHPRDALQLLERVLEDLKEGTTEIEKHLSKLVDEVLDLNPEKMAYNYLDALVDPAAAKADAFAISLRVSERPDLFLSLCMDIVRNWGYAVCGATKMIDPHWRRFTSRFVEDYKTIEKEDIYTLFSALFTAYGETKKYLFRPQDVMFRLTLKGMSLFEEMPDDVD